MKDWSAVAALAAVCTLFAILWQSYSAKIEARRARTTAYLGRYFDALSRLRRVDNISEDHKYATHDLVPYKAASELLSVAEEFAGLYRKKIVDREMVKESLLPSIGWLDNAYGQIVILRGRDSDKYSAVQYLADKVKRESMWTKIKKAISNLRKLRAPTF